MSDASRVKAAFNNGDEETLRELLVADGYEWARPPADAATAAHGVAIMKKFGGRAPIEVVAILYDRLAAHNQRLSTFVDSIADLRSRAADGPRDTYTVVLGQLVGKGMITEDHYRKSMDKPRERR